MLALSIVAPNGANIAAGRKTLEIRSWCPPRLPLRDLLIIENRIFLTGEDEVDPNGVAVAVVDVDEVHAWRPSELDAACATEWKTGPLGLASHSCPSCARRASTRRPAQAVRGGCQ